jgi:outer membrane lipoprotein SlyB
MKQFIINHQCKFFVSMKMRRIFLIALTSLPLFLTNCAPKLGGSDYAMADVGANSTSLRGSIVALRVININASQPNQPGVGAGIGAVSGAVIGNVVSNHGPFTTLAGGLLGGVAGHFAEQGLTSQEGIEYTVQLDSGEVHTIAQGAEPRMSVGQRVIVVLNNKGYAGQQARSRVVPDNSAR